MAADIRTTVRILPFGTSVSTTQVNPIPVLIPEVQRQRSLPLPVPTGTSAVGARPAQPRSRTNA